VDSDRERWDGFWCVVDERYYTRCTRRDGSTQWFRIAEEAITVRQLREARVLPMRRRADQASVARRTILVGSRSGTRTMLVGASRRRPQVGGTRGLR
jgi:hypothetical protein